jgi:hypothetical protein
MTAAGHMTATVSAEAIAKVDVRSQITAAGQMTATVSAEAIAKVDARSQMTIFLTDLYLIHNDVFFAMYLIQSLCFTGSYTPFFITGKTKRTASRS